jgi:hypothetical protein
VCLCFVGGRACAQHAYVRVTLECGACVLRSLILYVYSRDSDPIFPCMYLSEIYERPLNEARVVVSFKSATPKKNSFNLRGDVIWPTNSWEIAKCHQNINDHSLHPYLSFIFVQTRDENGTDTAGYRVIPYPTLIYFSRIRDQIRLVKIRDGYRTRPGNNPDG